MIQVSEYNDQTETIASQTIASQTVLVINMFASPHAPCTRMLKNGFNAPRSERPRNRKKKPTHRFMVAQVQQLCDKLQPVVESMGSKKSVPGADVSKLSAMLSTTLDALLRACAFFVAFFFSSFEFRITSNIRLEGFWSRLSHFFRILISRDTRVGFQSPKENNGSADRSSSSCMCSHSSRGPSPPRSSQILALERSLFDITDLVAV